MTTNEIEILLVEDNPADVELTLRAFRHNHLANPIQVVNDGEEALDYLFARGAYRGRTLERPLKLVLPTSSWRSSRAWACTGCW
ncbi:MAG TPA: hypothetical protein VHM88_27690 [Candidatus Acidoferrales bacterium]|nr:hypothetical protein [Candidatus Acidoferrales bacterium]